MHSLTEAAFRRSACYFLSSHDVPVKQLTDVGHVTVVDTRKKVTGALLPPACLLATDAFWCSDSVCCLPEVPCVLDTTNMAIKFGAR